MEKTKNINVKKVATVTLNVLFYFIIVVLLVFSIANIRVKKESDIPHVFGWGFLSVRTDSMEGEEEDSFLVGDLLIVRMVNDKIRSELKVGDIVTYYDLSLRGFNTHRIVDIGGHYFVTQGDKVAMNPARKYDPESNTNDATAYEIVNKSDVLAVHKSTWSGAGTTLNTLQSPVGFAAFVILPVFVLLVVQGVVLVRNVMNLNKAKLSMKHEQEKEEVKKELEAEKEKIRAQLMEEMKKEQEEKNKTQE